MPTRMQQQIRRVTGVTRAGNAGGRRSPYQTSRDARNYFRRKSTGGMGG